jgi:hypothetical protein
MTSPSDEVRAADRRLQAAMLTSDVAALERLLDDRLIYTGGPDGGVYSKEDDLRIHRSGTQVLSRVEEEELTVLAERQAGVSWFLGTLEGTFAGEQFTARLRFTRTWFRDDEHGWRLVAAHASPAT